MNGHDLIDTESRHLPVHIITQKL